MQTKVCSKCGIEKSIDNFCKNNHFKDKLNSCCKICEKEKFKKWYLKNKEKRKEYKFKNKEKIKQQKKDWRLKNIEICLKRSKDYREEHKEETKKQIKDWNLKNKDYYKERQRKLRKTDITFRLIGNTRSSFNRALNLNIKSGHTIELLGCSIDFFKKYLESKFQPDMSWDNYGKGGWVIDHIKPVSSFDFNNPEEQNKCEHYTNKQPLWEINNLEKSNKF